MSGKLAGRRVLLCSCEGTMALDAKALGKALGVADTHIHSNLCRAELAVFEKAADGGEPLLVACTAEAPLFLESLEDLENPPDAAFVNIRETAGWAADGKKAGPKIAALLAEAALDMGNAATVTMQSGGALLVLGRDETALAAAGRLASRLDVTVVLDPGSKVMPPRVINYPIFAGKVSAASGHLGAFDVEIADFAPAEPSSRDLLRFGLGAAKGRSRADLILDLRGGPALFSAPEKRDGYFNPDPGNPALVERALFDAADLVGSFEKPRYVVYDSKICAHTRSGITGCSRCVDICPAGAVTSMGEQVAFDPFICGGCGSCASVCPTGAAAYAMPGPGDVQRRLATVIGTYGEAGGKAPVLLMHDTDHGAAIIDALARFGDGLAANVLPFALNQVTQLGLDGLLAGPALGASAVAVLADPKRSGETDGLAEQIVFANHVLAGLGYGDGRLSLITEADPDKVAGALRAAAKHAPLAGGGFVAKGSKRDMLGVILGALHDRAPKPVDSLEMPAGSPFGTIDVNIDGCTLCLACVGACPASALRDNPDMPQLRFMEQACVQCGLCVKTCPEGVMTLHPRLDFTGAARNLRTVKEEQPFECLRCGKPFGALSTIEKMMKKLENHPAFSDPAALNRLKMCDDCRIIDASENAVNPLAGPERPRVRTTDDYLAEREAGLTDGGSDDT